MFSHVQNIYQRTARQSCSHDLPVVLASLLLLAGALIAPSFGGQKPGQDRYSAAQTHLERRNYDEAADPMRAAAEAGHPGAMAGLAYMLWHGLGMERDRKSGLRWYRKAAAAGHTGAMIELGKALKFGNNVAPDIGQARLWIERAARAGDVEGMFRLGIMHQFGEGVPANADKARHWFSRAAGNGHTGAEIKLKLMAPAMN